MTNQTTTEIALVELPKFNLPAPTEIAAKMNDSFNSIYTKIEAEIAQLLGDLDAGSLDIETKAHREKLKSLAYKISRTKTGLDESAAKLMAETKAMNDAVNAERRGMRETLDALRDKAKEPAAQWAAKEAIRLQKVQQIVDDLTNIRVVQRGDKLLSECTSAEISAALETMAATTYNAELLGDRREEVVFLHGEALAYLRDLLATTKQREADEKELAELRAAKAEQERIAVEAAAKEQAEADKLAAINEEKSRQARIRESEREATEQREADLEHRKKINNAILAAIVAASDVAEDDGKMIIQAISKGQIPHVKISY